MTALDNQAVEPELTATGERQLPSFFRLAEPTLEPESCPACGVIAHPEPQGVPCYDALAGTDPLFKCVLSGGVARAAESYALYRRNAADDLAALLADFDAEIVRLGELQPAYDTGMSWSTGDDLFREPTHAIVMSSSAALAGT